MDVSNPSPSDLVYLSEERDAKDVEASSDASGRDSGCAMLDMCPSQRQQLCSAAVRLQGLLQVGSAPGGAQ